MKHVKRIASLLLVLVMAMTALAVPAMAVGEGPLDGGSIEISNAYKGETYRAYQLMYLESYNASTGVYAYKANSAWETWLRTKTTYVKFDDQGYVTWVENADVAAFAQAALAYAQDQNNNISEDAFATAEERAANDPVNATTKVIISDLKLGYYLVDSSLGAICSLDTTNPKAPIEDKNSVPDIKKEVKEGNAFGSQNDAQIGDTVEFQTTITAKVGARNYVVHDKMDDGLTFDADSVKITLNGTAVADNNYTVKTTEPDDDCTFEIHFGKTFLDGLKTNDEIVISYAATLNENADVTKGENNTTKLTFGNQNETEWKPTTTHTWDVDIFKYTKDGETEKALSGAIFTLSKNNGGSNPIALISEGNNVYRVAKSGESGASSQITTDATGKFTIKGLDSGTYYLTETTAPLGYNKLSGPITVVIGNDGKTTVDNTVVNEVRVENKTGTELPGTGGMGTTIFYVLGGALMLGAAVLFITKKRMGHAEK